MSFRALEQALREVCMRCGVVPCHSVVQGWVTDRVAVTVTRKPQGISNLRRSFIPIRDNQPFCVRESSLEMSDTGYELAGGIPISMVL